MDVEFPANLNSAGCLSSLTSGQGERGRDQLIIFSLEVCVDAAAPSLHLGCVHCRSAPLRECVETCMSCDEQDAFHTRE